MTKYNFFIYLLVMAGVTYLIRMLPLVLSKKKITNKFILSFLYYIPYAVLTAMTIPGIFYSVNHKISAFFGFIAALIPAYKGKSLLKVAISACMAVFLAELIFKFIIL